MSNITYYAVCRGGVVSRVNVGDIRRSPSGDYVVMSVERGRAGESRTVYVVGVLDGSRVLARETRGESVRGCPLVGRLKLRVAKSPWGLTAEVIS